MKMKLTTVKKVFAALALTLTTTVINAQSNLGVGTATPDASAKLDITSSTQGILVPRMKTSDRTAIASPAKGLMVYDSTAKSFYYHNGTAWNAVGGASTTQLPNAFVGHLTSTSAVAYISPLSSNSSATVTSSFCFLVPSACTLNITFSSFEDEGLTFELFEVAPVSTSVTYTTTGTALATAATTGWVSGSPTTASFNYAATAGKVYIIKVSKTGGGNFATQGGFYTSFYAN